MAKRPYQGLSILPGNCVIIPNAIAYQNPLYINNIAPPHMYIGRLAYVRWAFHMGRGGSRTAPTINVQDPNPKKCDRIITASFSGEQNHLKFWGNAIKTINLIFFK